MRDSTVGRPRVGRPPVFSDAHVKFRGVSLHPAQMERLTATARQRGTTFSGLVREVLTAWERDNGLVPTE